MPPDKASYLRKVALCPLVPSKGHLAGGVTGPETEKECWGRKPNSGLHPASAGNWVPPLAKCLTVSSSVSPSQDDCIGWDDHSEFFEP